MGIGRRAQGGFTGNSAHTPRYRAIFRKHVFTLLKMGYELLDTPAFLEEEEPAITGDLAQAMNEIKHQARSAAMDVQLGDPRRSAAQHNIATGKIQASRRSHHRTYGHLVFLGVHIRGQTVLSEQRRLGISRQRRLGHVPLRYLCAECQGCGHDRLCAIQKHRLLGSQTLRENGNK